jgi:predicted ATPase with chaperone activity
MSEIMLQTLGSRPPHPPMAIAIEELEAQDAAASLAPLLRAVSPAPEEQHFIPRVPQSLEEVGVSETIIEELVLKTVYARGEAIGRDLAASMGVKFSLIERIVESLKRQRMIEVKGSLGFGSVSAVFGLSEAGRMRVRECLDHNQYIGEIPVPIPQYNAAVRSQRLKSGWLNKAGLKRAYEGISISDEVLNQIGPAVNSGKSFLLYGQAGNGKTYLAEALFNLDSAPIYVPYAIEFQGVIIKVFDPVYHQRIDEAAEMTSSVSADARYDARWVRCRRPFIVTGGELSISMLDLGYNSTARIYDAPFQLKANNGIYLIDDFGRQKASPAEVLNRWIVPMDRRVDFLTFQEGGKVEVPFETFLIFSTNLQPEQLGDEAFLRRLQYKMFLRNPERREFSEIFLSFAASQGLDCPPDMLDRFINRRYTAAGKPFRRCQPRDVISHAIDLLNFEQLPFELTDDLLDRAFASCFLEGVQED